jgi:hypothetical protein
MNTLREYGPSPIHRARFIRFLHPDDPTDTEARPEDIARAKQKEAWGFPVDCCAALFEDVKDRLPAWILDFKHGD